MLMLINCLPTTHKIEFGHASCAVALQPLLIKITCTEMVDKKHLFNMENTNYSCTFYTPN